MKSLKISIILAVLVLELAWFCWPRFYIHGRILDEPYRNAERGAVLYAYRQHPTSETKSAYDAEVALLDRHEMQVAMAILIGVLAFDAVGIYLFWKYAPTKTAANTKQKEY